MDTGVILLNFGEPEKPDKQDVVSYLKRIFVANASIVEKDDDTSIEKRAQQLAEKRAPGLIEEYEVIDGSPLNKHAISQVEDIQAELNSRGYKASIYSAMQYTEPFIDDTVDDIIDDGVEKIVALPVYPLCGPSTTVASLKELSNVLDKKNQDIRIFEITGWHTYPVYNRIRSDNMASFAEKNGINLQSSDTEVIFSAHGTPQYYLEEGSRYEKYVKEYCDTISSILDIDYRLGYQNHENRDIPWTQPEVEDVINDVEADTVIVEPISFMHEQSETLFELDYELREEAENNGLNFYRVPIPYGDDRFPSMLVDLMEPFLSDFSPKYYNLEKCICRKDDSAFCLNS